MVPPSGNMEATGRQFWLGPRRVGQVITFWADTDVIHLTTGGLRVKSVRSHLSTAGHRCEQQRAVGTSSPTAT